MTSLWTVIAVTPRSCQMLSERIVCGDICRTMLSINLPLNGIRIFRTSRRQCAGILTRGANTVISCRCSLQFSNCDERLQRPVQFKALSGRWVNLVLYLVCALLQDKRANCIHQIEAYGQCINCLDCGPEYNCAAWHILDNIILLTSAVWTIIDT